MKIYGVLVDSYYFCENCKKRLGLFGLILHGLRKHRVVPKYVEEDIEV